jgi:hypothetical protein
MFNIIKHARTPMEDVCKFLQGCIVGLISGLNLRRYIVIPVIILFIMNFAKTSWPSKYGSDGTRRINVNLSVRVRHVWMLVGYSTSYSYVRHKHSFCVIGPNSK